MLFGCFVVVVFFHPKCLTVYPVLLHHEKPYPHSALTAVLYHIFSFHYKTKQHCIVKWQDM